ncbi:beta-L-arabinofuranosidase domain-containing protein [Hydrogenoanaerobacterium sp.]|uniref:glycoside hydrolase family 127 protein n=1 Tax=Hydrogenoanaerobacterium sp. TaxID=2953763 RepID=UPI00289C6EB0|nr:beta-L-arabinofuranosidase domain-containing protein [Hydrogenoanaerobacterium sp.]
MYCRTVARLDVLCNCKKYKHVLNSATAPTVTAEFAEADSVTVTQAATVPGTAIVSVKSGATTTDYTIEFSLFNGDLANLKMPEIEQVKVSDGFWKEKLTLFEDVTIEHVFDNFERTGTLENFKKIGQPGARPSGSTDPWNDGLLYETIRGASDFMRANPNSEQYRQLKKRIDGYVDIIYDASMESANGYLSSWAMMERAGKYFDETGNARWYHDAYNFGCLAEAAVHYYKATGNTKLLYVATRFAEFLVDNYGYGLKADGTQKINMIPSHEGPEEMLLKLYELYRDEPELKSTVAQYDASRTMSIDENEYADLVKFWIENHGNYDNRVNGTNYGEYAQDHARYFDQDVAAGHAVRANLFYTGMAAAGREFGDYTYLDTAQKLWRNIVDKQMYITGGVGAQGADEAYGPNYDLPNNGYCETCAQVAMGFFSEHMALAFADSQYADLVEKYIYDGVLGSVGEKGDTFYYQQPLTDKNRGRWSWIDHTPCCPPMFLKFYGELPSYIYAYDGSEVYVNQFISSKLELDGVTVEQKSQMPWGGKTTLTGKGVSAFHIRLPEWAESERIAISVNGKPYAYTTKNGYAVVSAKDGETVEVEFPMEARREYSDENVVYNRGKVALAYGPLVYCVESKDIPLYVPGFNKGDGNIGIPADAVLSTKLEPDLLGGVVTIGFEGQYYDSNGELRSMSAKAIPFFARSNRGSASTFVWIDEDVKQSGGKMKRWLSSASSTRDNANTAAAAFDGNTDTYWAAGGPDIPQALIVDLGELKQVEQVKTTFTSAQAWKYQVLYSADGENWNLFADNASNAVNQQVYTDTGLQEARYIAVKFVESAGVGYISVQEIAVMEQGSSQNIAKNKMCAASSVANVGDSVFAMIDGDKQTRYCPPGEAKPQSLTMDMGELTQITGMKILFEKPTAWTYQIELSEDGNKWTPYISETWNMSEDDEEKVIEKEATGRYVRLTISGATGGVWASVWEFDVQTKEPTRDIFDALLGQTADMEAVLDLKPGTPALKVEGMDDMFSLEDKEIASQPGAKVQIKVAVEKVDAPTDQAVVQQAIQQGQTIAMYLDIKMLKTITGAANSQDNVADQEIQPPAGKKLKFVIELPQELWNKATYFVVKAHQNTAAILPAAYDQKAHTLTFYGDQFSTYAIAYGKATTSGNSGNGKSDGASSDDSYNFWQNVKGRIEASKSGDIVKVSAKAYDRMPYFVMEALNKHNISMVIYWNGGNTITIPAGMGQKVDAGRVYWQLSELAERYKDVKFVETAVNEMANPETGGPGYIEYNSGKTVPVTGAIQSIEASAVADPLIKEAAPADKKLEDDAVIPTAPADATDTAYRNNISFAVATAMLIILVGSGVWFWKKKHTKH